MSTNDQDVGPGPDEHDAYEPESNDDPGGEASEDEIPEGMYNVRGVEGSEQIGFAETGTKQVSVLVDFVDLNRQATTILYFSDKTEVDSLKRLRALGWEGGDTLAGISKNVARATVKYETYNGKRRRKVEIFIGGRFVMKNQMADKERRDFFKQLNDLAKREASGQPAPAQRGTQTGAKGYPKDWDKPGSAPSQQRSPRVNLG